MLNQILVLGTVVSVSLFTAAHFFFLWKIRRIKPLPEINEARRSALEKFWRLDRLRIRSVLGVLVSFAACVYLTSSRDECSSWRCGTLSYSTLTVCAIFLFKMFVVSQYNALSALDRTARYLNRKNL